MAIKRGRGRPPRSVLERCRALVWYHAVKAREGLNDHQLGKKFASVADNMDASGTAHSIRIFETIRRNGTIPSQGKHHRRNYDLVKCVDSVPEYHGTAAIITSPFWKLMTGKNDLKEIRKIVAECISRLGLVNQPGQYEDDGSSIDLKAFLTKTPELTIEEFDYLQKTGDEAYDNAMASAFHLDETPSLDYVALFGALALEALYAGNLRIAKEQCEIFSKMLWNFCTQRWLSEYEDEPLYFGDEFYWEIMERMEHFIEADPLEGLPDYDQLLGEEPNFNPGSPVMAFLKRHQRLLWRR